MMTNDSSNSLSVHEHSGFIVYHIRLDSSACEKAVVLYDILTLKTLSGFDKHSIKEFAILDDFMGCLPVS